MLVNCYVLSFINTEGTKIRNVEEKINEKFCSNKINIVTGHAYSYIIEIAVA